MILSFLLALAAAVVVSAIAGAVLACLLGDEA